MLQQKQSEDLLHILKKSNTFLLPESSRSECVPFYVGSVVVGLVRPDFLKQLKAYPDVFVLHDGLGNEQKKPRGLYLNEDFSTFELRSSKVEAVLRSLQEKDTLVTLRGWREETYDVTERFGAAPLLKLERSAACLFGITQYGVHINGYVVDDIGEMSMWIGRRSKTKQTYPNLLDNMCAGGLASGLGILECAIKEAEEEAGIPEEDLDTLEPTGCVSYFFEDERGLFPECEFIFDLQLPTDFEPKNKDGEMQSFQLLSISKVIDLIVSDEFKPNCALVIVDFLIRHGIITPDSEPNYTRLVEMMHVSLTSFYTSTSTGRTDI